jgi:hypothetical protein
VEIGVQILNVSVSSTKAGRGFPEGHLLIRLRAYQFGKGSPSSGALSNGPGDELGRPVLTDNAGKIHGLRSEQGPGIGANAQKASSSVVAFVDVVYDFEPPSADVKYLRLEVPGKATGVAPFRFTIPKTMFLPQ